MYARDGYDYDGYKLRVEFPRGGGFRGATGAASYGESGRARGPPARRSSFRCIVSGLPPTGSWQDLKDHMREAGDVCFADVFKDGTGAVEYTRREDLQYAIKKLDDTRFKSHEVTIINYTYVSIRSYLSGESSLIIDNLLLQGETAHIRVEEDQAASAAREDGRDDDDRGDRDRGGRGGGSSSRRRSRSRSRSPRRSGGRRGSPSYSPVRRRRSRSRS